MTDHRLRIPAAAENHANQFGIVRLVLAALVLLSHSFPLADGVAHREPLQTLTGTTTFGELSVDFFFVISGYLVSQSLDRSRSIGAYLSKRVRRIYPGFAIAVAVSVAVALTCGGRWQTPDDIVNLLLSYGILRQPVVAAAFGGNAYPIANGSLWTIQYEFCCYLFPVALLLTRLHRRRALIFAAAVAMVVLSDLNPRDGGTAIASLHNALRLSGMFLAGIGFRLLDDRWWSRPGLATLSAGVAAAALFVAPAAGLGLALPGGYALLALCRHPGRSALSRVGRRTDMSYGVYLYAWPIQSTIVWLVPGIGGWAVFAIATPLVMAAGWLSWTFVEARFLKRQRRDAQV